MSTIGPKCSAEHYHHCIEKGGVQNPLRPFKKYVTRLGGRRLDKKVTKCDKEGGGSVKKVTSLAPKISFAVFHLFVLRKSAKYIISLNFCVTAPVFASDMGERGVKTKDDKV